MVKGFILGSSVVSLIFLILWQMADYFNFTDSQKMIFGAISVILWIFLLIIVFNDVKKNKNKSGWVTFTFFTGGLGGFIYSILAKDNEVDSVQIKQESVKNYKSAAIFNFFISGILVLSVLFTLRSVSFITLILFALAMLFFLLGRYLWKK